MVNKNTPFKYASLKPDIPRFYWSHEDGDGLPATEGTGHLHWGVIAFETYSDHGELLNSLQIEIEAATEELAFARARAIVARPFYRINWVREACSKDKELKDDPSG